MAEGFKVVLDRSKDPTLNDDSQPSVTTSAEAMRLADEAAGVPASVAKVQAPADAIDLQARIMRAEETPIEGVEELVALDEAKEARANVVAEAADGGEGSESPEFGSGRYEDRTNDQLRALLTSKGFSSAGNKDELVARLRGEE